MEIIPKPAQKLPLWQNILFYLSLALVLAAVLSYFLLNSSFKKSEISLKNLEETLTREKLPREVNLEKEILSWQRKIKDFSQLFAGHLYPSKVFDFFSNLTHPRVWFSQFSLDLTEAKMALSGEAESFTDLQQQLLILDENPQIKSSTLSSLAIGRKGKVVFTLNLSLDPQVFK